MILQLKQLGIQQSKLDDFEVKSFINVIILCFQKIATMLVEEENFIDIAYLKKQNLNEASHRFKVCQKLVEYFKTLEYLHDISFNSFLYPNVKDTRKLLGFLFELIFKGDSGSGQQKQQERPTNEAEVLLKRRLTTWSKRPWLLPDFFNG